MAWRLDNPLWDFSCALYAAPGVQGACLALQDHHGSDVNLLLLAAWLGAARGSALTDALLGQAPAAAWRNEVVRPLRAARRAMDRDDPAEAALRRDLLACELAAERLEHARLWAWAEARCPPGPLKPGLARANLGVVLDRPGTGAALDTLARAAEALASG